LKPTKAPRENHDISEIIKMKNNETMSVDNIRGSIEAMRSNQAGADEVTRAIKNEMGKIKDFTRNTDQALEGIRDQQGQVTPMNWIPPRFGGIHKRRHHKGKQ
jgi:hypothetical protein